MSVAGKRSGLDGSRSSLFYEAIRIIKEMRCATHGQYPRWICWENVPGAFSSNGGADFKAVLEAVIGIIQPGATVPAPENGRWPHADEYLGDRWSVAYRTLDAQYWGVPQRRRRIYLVADFADQCAGKVLFESEGVSGYSAESFRTWQRATQGIADGPRTAGRDGWPNGIILNDQGGNRMDVSEDVTCTLRAEAHHPPCVMEAAGFCTDDLGEGRCNELAVQAFGICSKDSLGMRSANPHVGFYPAQTSKTLDAGGGHPGCNQGGIAIVAEEPVFTMTTGSFQNTGENVAPSLLARDYKEPTAVAFTNGQPVYTVRRLTTTECSRLQGFPDWWCSQLDTPEPTEADIRFWAEVFETQRRITGTSTKAKTEKQIIKWLRHPHSDAAEYKMWGNGIALPCAFFVLAGIVWCTQLEDN